jgi:hypothetical protein
LYVGELARACSLHANLHVFVAYDPIPAYFGELYLQDSLDRRLKHTQRILEDALRQVGETPSELKTEILEGSAAEARY